MAVIMTQELADKLIAYYERFKEDYKEETILNILKSRAISESIYSGACNLASTVFAVGIYDCKWVNSKPTDKYEYWGVRPQDTKTVKEFWAAIQLRIDILKQFPN